MSIIERIMCKLLSYRDIVKDGSLYMRRFYLIPKWFRRLTGRGIFIHHIFRSDEDRAPHNHPWRFLTIMLAGRYVEHFYTYHGDHRHSVVTYNFMRFGRWLYRRATDTHRVFMDRPCWTLVFVGKTTQRWGFWTDKGWVYWKDYLGVSEGKDNE